MPAFDFVVVGCGGGPSETDLSAYLVKPYGRAWEDGVLGIEAGSGLGALRKVVKAAPEHFLSRPDEDGNTKTLSAGQIHGYTQSYLISHAHLDHVSGLVLSAGSCKGPRKRVYATPDSLETLETIFSDRVWPKLASAKEDDGAWMLLYSKLQFDDYQDVGCGISVKTMPISHGHNDTIGTYESAAFFVRNNAPRHEFLFFGDVEPDTISRTPRNAAVWRVAAEKIVAGVLDTVFIECSWPSGRTDEALFGHLTPEHLVEELDTLVKEVDRCRRQVKQANKARRTTPPASDAERSGSPGPVRKRRRTNPQLEEENTDDEPKNALKGVRVIVIHCKDDLEDTFDRSIAHVITDQISALVEQKQLGAEIISAEQGMHISI